MSPYLKVLSRYWYVVVVIFVITTLLGFVISIFQTPKYRSTVEVLIIQRHGTAFSAVTAAQSAEAIAKVLTKVVYTNTFLDDVLDSGFDVKKEFPVDPEERNKEWEKTVDVDLTDVSGILEINAYAEDRYQAEQIALAVAYVFTTKGKQYHGGGEAIGIKMIESPITTDKPAVPNFPRNIAIGFVLGLVAGLGVVYLIRPPEEEKVEYPRPPKAEEKKVALPKVPPGLAKPVKPKEFRPKEIPRPKPKEEKKEIPKVPKPPTPEPEEEAYTPEKVDRWIKTGKFE